MKASEIKLQNLFLKGLVVQVLSIFVNTILAAGVGEKLFGGKVVITESDEEGTTVLISLGRTTKYEATFKKVG